MSQRNKNKPPCSGQIKLSSPTHSPPLSRDFCVVQSQAQEAVVRLRNSMESEWRSKYEQASEELRQLKQQVRDSRETTSAENLRLKVRSWEPPPQGM